MGCVPDREKIKSKQIFLGPTQNRTAICRIRICCANHYTMGPFGPFVWVFPDEQGVQIDYASTPESWPHVSNKIGRVHVHRSSYKPSMSPIQRGQLKSRVTPRCHCNPYDPRKIRCPVGRDPTHAPLPTERRLLESGERTTLWSTESFCDPASRSTGASSRPRVLRSSTPKGLPADRQETLLQAK